MPPAAAQSNTWRNRRIAAMVFAGIVAVIALAATWPRTMPTDPAIVFGVTPPDEATDAAAGDPIETHEYDATRLFAALGGINRDPAESRWAGIVAAPTLGEKWDALWRSGDDPIAVASVMLRIMGDVDADNWRQSGGLTNDIEADGDVLTITASRSNHRRILALLAAIWHEANADPTAMIVDATDPKLLAVWERLATPIEVRFDATPLDTALAEIGRKAGLSIAVNWRSLEGVGIEPSRRVTFAATGQAAVVLDALLEVVGGDLVRFGIAAGPEGLEVVTFESLSGYRLSVDVWIGDLADYAGRYACGRTGAAWRPPSAGEPPSPQWRDSLGYTCDRLVAILNRSDTPDSFERWSWGESLVPSRRSLGYRHGSPLDERESARATELLRALRGAAAGPPGSAVAARGPYSRYVTAAYRIGGLADARTLADELRPTLGEYAYAGDFADLLVVSGDASDHAKVVARLEQLRNAAAR